MELGGHEIPTGRIVICVIGAANHDPAVLERPGTLMLRREPNPHLAFSSGAHFCLGATLARAEARLMLRGLVDRLPGLEYGGLAAVAARVHDPGFAGVVGALAGVTPGSPDGRVAPT